jgi:hypothetical protein
MHLVGLMYLNVWWCTDLETLNEISPEEQRSNFNYDNKILVSVLNLVKLTKAILTVKNNKR